ncbi:MAG: lipopolysaccharide heptosyltransferase II [Candidatus Accumulibacter sp.]|jgi:heptosyltransferase-2|nr:lipopolysaccharide heptosyltransferase II [Accumulibacter sp.]
MPRVETPPESAADATPLTPPADAPRCLVVMPSWIGDALMAHPLLMRLHEAGYALDAFAPPWVAPLLARIPEIDRILVNPFAHGELALAARRHFARNLDCARTRRAVVLPNSLKSALIPFFAGIPERVGFTGEARFGLINRRHVLDKAVLPRMVERFAQLAEPPGAPLKRPLPEPKLSSTPEEQAAALETFALRGKKYVVFCPGAEYGPAKRWPARHYATLASEFARRGFTVCLLGSAKDAVTGDEIVAAGGQPPPLNLCGKTTLTQAIDVIAASTLVVCNDSGLMHVAAALDRPLVALYGSSSPTFTPPLSKKARILSLDLPCAPCFRRQCPLGHFDCLNLLEPARVFEASIASIQETGADS